MVFTFHALHVPLMWAGVDLFFILSGYLITGILLRDRDRMSFGQMLRSFYVRRAERILPAYILFMAIAYLTLHVDWTHIWGYYVFFLQNVPFAFNVAPSFALIPLWSLAVEQHFYLIWPLLVFFLPRRWLPGAMIAVLVGEPVLRALCTPLFSTSEAIYCLTPFRLDAMAAGALCALWLPNCNPKKTIRVAQATMLLAFAVTVALGVHPWFRRSENTPLFNGLIYSLNILVLGGLFVWTVLSRGTPLVRVLSNPVLRGLGRISYMFYLLHLLVLESVSGYLARGFPGLSNEYAAAGIGFAITAAIATLSWFVLEKPVLSLSAAHRRAAPATPVAGV